MVDLRVEFCGVAAPNPFWLASAPPTNSEYQVRRAFDAGWGGAVWKTLAEEPIVNVSSRYGGIDYDGRKVMGLNNIELITDRPLDVNLEEIARVKKAYPERALFVSLMVESTREAWHEITKQTQDAGADGIELNFGCPHGMSERGMGSAVGQVPDYTCMITEWVKEVATIPVMVKLTPNVTDVAAHRPGGGRGRCRCASRSSTRSTRSWAWISTRSPPSRRSAATAVTAATVARRSSRSPSTWSPPSPAIPKSRCRSAASAASRPGKTRSSSCCWAPARCRSAPPSCTTASASSSSCRAAWKAGCARRATGRSTTSSAAPCPGSRPWGELDLNYKIVAEIDQDKCIHCGLCYIACEDGATNRSAGIAYR